MNNPTILNEGLGEWTRTSEAIRRLSRLAMLLGWRGGLSAMSAGAAGQSRPPSGYWTAPRTKSNLPSNGGVNIWISLKSFNQPRTNLYMEEVSRGVVQRVADEIYRVWWENADSEGFVEQPGMLLVAQAAIAALSGAQGGDDGRSDARR
jgi:hypothetical protein